jgi:hypothetical protein
MRTLLAVLAGYALWTALWLGGGFLFRRLWSGAYPEDFPASPMTAVVPLVATLALSVLCSLVGGRLARDVGRGSSAVWILAVALLATGVAVQASVWEAMPLWYHLPFLALLVPATRLGGRRRVAA